MAVMLLLNSFCRAWYAEVRSSLVTIPPRLSFVKDAAFFSFNSIERASFAKVVSTASLRLVASCPRVRAASARAAACSDDFKQWSTSSLSELKRSVNVSSTASCAFSTPSTACATIWRSSVNFELACAQLATSNDKLLIFSSSSAQLLDVAEDVATSWRKASVRMLMCSQSSVLTAQAKACDTPLASRITPSTALSTIFA
mmetsp:Transcript_7496/g.13465  ORF Transcript_7496/g.13465 Transcript_7496/m.13465 type:complete len:200 (-) Transcript_7496:1421-2020(-)